jgi:Protein of unknown function (DUF2917)
MDWGPTLVRTVDLGYEQMLLLESHPRTRIKVIYGGVWLTEEGQVQDVFAASGDEVALKSRGLAVVEGLGYARVQVMEPPLGWRSVAASVRRVGDAVASYAHRFLSLSRGSAARSHSAV